MQNQLALILFIIGVFEIIFFFDLKTIFLKNFILYKKFYNLFKFNHVSDSRKEIVIKNYSLKLFVTSFKIILIIIVIFFYSFILNIIFTNFYIYLVNLKSFVLLTLYSLCYYNIKKFINGKLYKNSKNTS